HTGFFVMFPSWLRHTVLPLRETGSDRIAISLNAVCGLPPEAPNMQLPHRMKKWPPGESPEQEFDPTAPVDFPYPL
ncbi:MAG: hypothetical protein P4L84_25440, partial [Isosphaeraceae bacterium]|nr:hypothetical protein [Isosphaeraceae bacterium]